MSEEIKPPKEALEEVDKDELPTEKDKERFYRVIEKKADAVRARIEPVARDVMQVEEQVSDLERNLAELKQMVGMVGGEAPTTGIELLSRYPQLMEKLMKSLDEGDPMKMMFAMMMMSFIEEQMAMARIQKMLLMKRMERELLGEDSKKPALTAADVERIIESKMEKLIKAKEEEEIKAKIAELANKLESIVNNIKDLERRIETAKAQGKSEEAATLSKQVEQLKAQVSAIIDLVKALGFEVNRPNERIPLEKEYKIKEKEADAFSTVIKEHIGPALGELIRDPARIIRAIKELIAGVSAEKLEEVHGIEEKVVEELPEFPVK